MQPGIVTPSAIVAELTDLTKVQALGVRAIVTTPSFLVDETFAFKVAPEVIPEHLGGDNILLAAIWSDYPIMDENGAEGGKSYISACIDLADSLRDYFIADALPVIVIDAGVGSRVELWDSLVAATKELAQIAEERSVLLALRPARGTLVDRSRNALKLLTEVGSGHLQLAFDAAATVGDKDTLDGAVDKMAGNTMVAFARDVAFTEDGTVSYPPPGEGMLNFNQYVELLGSAAGCTCLAVAELGEEAAMTKAIELVTSLTS